MNKFFIWLFVLFFSALASNFLVISLNAAELKAIFLDAKWDGKKIPDDQQCITQGGVNPSTPKIKVTGIPSGAKSILMTITDYNYGSAGLHGVFRFKVADGATEMVLPAIAETAKNFPSGVEIEKYESGGMSQEGNYLPPCSDRRSHMYASEIQVVDSDDEELALFDLEWGRY